MLVMNTQTSDPTDYRSGVIGSVIACFIFLACLVIADRMFWPGESADHIRHETVAKAR